MAKITKVHYGKTYEFSAVMSAAFSSLDGNCGMRNCYFVRLPFIDDGPPIKINGKPLPKNQWGRVDGDAYLKLLKLLDDDDIKRQIVDQFILDNKLEGAQILLSDCINSTAFQTYEFMYYLYTHQGLHGHITLGQGSYNKNHTDKTKPEGNHFIQAALWIPSVSGKDLTVKVDLESKTFKIPKDLQERVGYKSEFARKIEERGLSFKPPPSPSLTELGDLFPDFPPEGDMEPKETPLDAAKENQILEHDKPDLSTQKPMDFKDFERLMGLAQSRPGVVQQQQGLQGVGNNGIQGMAIGPIGPNVNFWSM